MWRVLVVEREQALRGEIIRSLDWDALDCTLAGEAACAEEALEAAGELAPSLFIIGLDGPEADGLELLRRLRAQGSCAEVILLSASDSFPLVRSAFRLGAADYLLKPLHMDELEQSIAGLRRRAGPGRGFPEVKKGEKSRYVLDAMAYIEAHCGEKGLGVGVLARYLGISEGHLSHIFKHETGCTPLNYLTHCRIRKAMELLRDNRLKVYEVAEQVGYRDITYFSATFKRLAGLSPSEYQDACR